jgi:hypothetical protein
VVNIAAAIRVIVRKNGKDNLTKAYFNKLQAGI